MTLDNAVEGLKEKALLMGRCYYKGFGNSIQGIFAVACNLVDDPAYDQDGKDAEEFLTLIERIEKFYLNIPFRDLQGKEDFYSLFVIRSLLPAYHDAYEQIVKTRDSQDLRRLQNISSAIVEVGRLYSERFSGILKNVRAFPGEEKFRVAVPDQLKEHIWYF